MSSELGLDPAAWSFFQRWPELVVGSGMTSSVAEDTIVFNLLVQISSWSPGHRCTTRARHDSPGGQGAPAARARTGRTAEAVTGGAHRAPLEGRQVGDVENASFRPRDFEAEGLVEVAVE